MKKTLRAALVLSFLFCSASAFAASTPEVQNLQAQPETSAAALPSAETAAAPATAKAAEAAPLAKTVFDQEQKKNVDACCFAACMEAWGACKRACNFEQSCLDQCWADWQWCKSVC